MAELPETIGPRSGSSPLTVALTDLGVTSLESAFAHFDGTGASGSWLPALTVRAQNGTIVGRVFPSTTLAAGDTADVTYIPFAEPEPGGATLTWDQGMILLGATGNLLGWWKLGDGPGTFADSNPYQAAADMTQTSVGAALTPHITGALAGAQDDGAVRFNGAGPTTPGDWLGATAARFDLTSDLSLTCWVNPTATVASFVGGIFGNAAGGALGTDGYGLFLSYPTMTLVWVRGDGTGFLKNVTYQIAAGAWYFVAATYSSTSGAELYVNGQLVGSDATTFAIGGHGGSIDLGLLGDGTNPRNKYFSGGVDEAAVWGTALAAADIANLYTYGTTA